MKKGIKKFIASALVLMMIMTMVPSFAFADTEPAAGGENLQGNTGESVTDPALAGNESGGGTTTKPTNDGKPGISAADGESSGSGISAVDDEGNVIAPTTLMIDNPQQEPMSLSEFGFGDFRPHFPGYGEGTDVPMIGYSKYVYVIPADLGEGAETWARINVVVEDADGSRTQIAHGAIPVGLSLINTVGISLTKEARDNGYTIKDVEAEHGLVYDKTLYKNVGYFTYYTVHTSFTHVITIVLNGGAATPDVDDGNVYLLYFDGLMSIGSDRAAKNAEGKAVFTLKDAPYEKEGYTFAGWQHGEELLLPGDKLSLEHSDSVYAVWTENEDPDKPDPEDPDKPEKETVTLSFDPNGGEGGPVSRDYKKGTTVSLDLIKPQPTHAAVVDEGGKEHDVLFLGWTDKAHPVLTSNDKRPIEQHLITMKNDRTVYALWSEDMNDNHIPDVDEKIHYTLSYDITMGKEGGPADKTDCIFAQKVALDYTEENMPKPTTDAEGNKIIFMYWTDGRNARKYDVANHVFGKDFVKEELPNKITSVQMIVDTTVYAVWSYDVNDDNIPDAFQDLVELKYDPVKGKGGPGTEMVVAGATAVLKNEPAPTHKDVDKVPVLFVGWTSEVDEKIYEKEDALPENLVTEIDVPKDSKGEVVYAVYGYDRDGNEIPDVLEHTLTYDNNGGKGGPGVVKVALQKDYVLETAEEKLPTHGMILKDNVLFYGWSTSRHLLPLTYLDHNNRPEDIVGKIDIDGDEIVYAVWAIDSNGNDIPDIDEDIFTLSFDVNGGNEPGPADVKLLEGMKYDLKLALPRPAHDKAADKAGNEYSVVLAGWTDNAYAGIWDKGDELPTDFYSEELIMPDHDKTVYALYGFDKNNDGKADVLQTIVHLTYDPVNGEGGPGTVEVEDGSLQMLDYENVPTHADVDGVKVIFWKWSRVENDAIYGIGDKKPVADIIPEFIPMPINGDTTVYALYAFDEDGNGKPDIDEYEKVFTLHYDPNGGLTAPADQKAYSKDGNEAYLYITSELPTHATDSFKGWATTPDGAAVFRAGQRVKLESDVTLYAVWGDKGSGNIPGGGGLPGGFGGGKGVPKTGDESNAALWAVLATLSVMGMGVTAVVVKKHHKHN